MQPSPDNIAIYRDTLLSWWASNARDFPWRHDRTPYRTAIAELMLRRTQARQVVPVYNAYIEAHPTLIDAAEATQDSSAAILYPLGLKWRAQNILDFVRDAREQYGADLPADAKKLRSLPGVGEYVGAAIACFAGNESVPLIDVNVARVLGRIFGIRIDGEARRRADMKLLAARCVPDTNPAQYHYAVLDFAALKCTARNPACRSCPFSESRLCNYSELTKCPGP